MTNYPAKNLLADETSPYLLQHQDNPVHWRPWGPDALAEAKALDKPVLLSVGYAACHWCHVMAHESFESDAIAAVMNDLFVNIKVDREERPDIDTIYMNSLSLLGQQGGWPLTMFLTPAGEPFWGGTYFPAEANYGRPGFPDVLRRVSEIYHSDKDLIDKNRNALVAKLGEMAETEPAPNGQTLRHDTVQQVAEKLMPNIDMDHGGMAGAPKFPNPPIFKLLFRAWQKTGNKSYKLAVTRVLDRMSEGGIYDHLGGGYARYSVDQFWLAPHFEKMLYDNAQILDLLTAAWLVDGTPLFAQRVRETVAWLEREMIAENGAFAATLDADSEGEEGKFYVWSEDEVRAVLADHDADLFCQIYNVTQAGNWEHTNILNRLHLDRTPVAEVETALAPMRAVLWAHRKKRIHPGWDDKVLADWNGLMIAALAEAGAAFDESDWIARAESAFEAVVRDLGYTDETDHARLYHSFRVGKAQIAAMLDDYANMARAALVLYDLTGKRPYLDQALRWVATLEAHFWDGDQGGGYFYTADDAEALIVRTKSPTDNAVPAGNGTMVEVLARLYLLTGNPAVRARADALISAFAPTVVRQAPSCATLVNGFDMMLFGTQVVVIGDRSDAVDLLRAVHSTPAVSRVLQVINPDDALPEGHPAHGKGQVDGQPTAYVCQGQTCSLPVTDAAALKALLVDSSSVDSST